MTTLETERLRLRPFRLENALDIADYAIWPEFASYMPIRPQTLESVTASVTGRVQAGQSDSVGNCQNPSHNNRFRSESSVSDHGFAGFDANGDQL